MAAQSTVKKPPLALLLLLLLLLALVLLVLPSLRIQTNTATQTASEGQCQGAGQNFDARQEAFTLAQAAEQYRTANPFGGNYGPGSYTICYKDGTQLRVQSPVFRGSGKITNDNHSEQSTYGWLQLQLPRLSIDPGPITAIYTVIFSQVTVCGPCERDMRLWQRTLRQKARTQQLFLSVWDIIYGKGFNPGIYPAGNGVPVTIDVLRQVLIPFVE